MPSKEIARQNRICIVLVCKAKNSDVPDRIFFPVPENKKQDWLERVGGDISSIKPKKRLFCCKNHFDVKKDVEGYDFYKHFGGRIKLMENAFPSKQLGAFKEFEKVEVMAPTEEPCEESVDPLSISDDRDEGQMLCDSFDEDNKFDTVQSDWNHADDKKEFDPVQLGWNIEQPKFDPSQSTRSEQIVVVSKDVLTSINP